MNLATVGPGTEAPGPHPTRKRYRAGTHRVRSPAETWEAVCGLAPRIGVTRVADVTGLDILGVPVYQAIRPEGRALSVSQGKGLSRAAARVGALMESLESWHAERLEDLPSVTMTLREMEYANAIPRRSLRWRAGATVLESRRIAWLRAESMAGGRHAWLPREMLSLDFRVSRHLEPSMFHPTSSGVASGNCLDEALLHGLCELIERHGRALVSSGAASLEPLDGHGIRDSDLQDVLERIRGRGLELALYDATWDIGVPVVAADLVGADLPVRFRGWGCHTSSEIALARALTEAIQSRLTYISGARDDVVFQDHARPWEVFDGFRPPRATRSLSALPDLATETVAEDLSRVVGRVLGLGFHPYFVDLTRDEIGVPVAICYVPGFLETGHA